MFISRVLPFPYKPVELLQIVSVGISPVIGLIVVTEIGIVAVYQMQRGNHTVKLIACKNLAYSRHTLVLQTYLHPLEQLEVSVLPSPAVQAQKLHVLVYGRLLGRHVKREVGHSRRRVKIQMVCKTQTAQTSLIRRFDRIYNIHAGVSGKIRMAVVVE